MATNMNEDIYRAMQDYIKTLHSAKAVDDIKMKFQGYLPIEELVKLWEIK